MVQRSAYPVQEVASALDASRALKVLLHTHTHTLSGQEVRFSTGSQVITGSQGQTAKKPGKAPSFLPPHSIYSLLVGQWVLVIC